MSSLGNKQIMSKNIQYYMTLHGKTRNDMCEVLGVKYSTFSDWVNGNVYPRIDKIELMANYFGINKSDLVERKYYKTDNTIAEKIKNKRTSNNITLEELGKKVGVSKQTVQRYESGVISNIPSDKIELMANALDTTPAYLMGWEEIADDISGIYSKLESSRQEIVLNCAREQLEEQNQVTSLIKEDGRLYAVKVIEKLAAGVGYQYNEENESSILYADKKLPGYDLASLIEGDSMEPKYNNGDVA